MISTAIQNLTGKTGYDSDDLYVIASDRSLNPSITYIAGQAGELLDDIRRNETKARQHLASVQSYATRAIDDLDNCAHNDGRWLATEATRAADALSQVQDASREFFKLTNLLDRARAALAGS